MRVAYVCADAGIPVFGQKGCSIHVQEVIRSLQGQGCQVDLFATRFGGELPADLINVAVHQLPVIPKQERAVREQVALAINPDLGLALGKVPPFDFIYERYSLWSYGAMEFAKSQGIPGLLEVNSPLITEQAQHRGLIDQQGAETVAHRVFNAATALIAVSEAVKTYLINYVDESQVHVIPNGVNPHRFSVRDAATQPESFTVGFVGTLKPWHGLPILSEAFALLSQRVPNAKLLIVGDGPERENLEAELAAKGLDAHTQFTGAVSPEQVPQLLAKMDVAVAPYAAQSDFYFSPLKVYEYMAAGLPVVVSRIGQLADLIDSGVNGILCPPGDAIALTNALEKLWRSPTLGYSLGQAARKTVIAHHTWDAIAHQILHIARYVEKRQ
ncbi:MULTISPECIES: glycosyltransferase family 4 protein [Cyanophyceae]|uniref:glycosyltransferase family 4 protein n=1 Tax=Cyanophyceae TaxID=3028117 RepID=UPI00232F93A0|nr:MULTISPECIES: glycosyltransferase family 4 protein [Cyanophyceae]MDB9358037.1 glycosyltransferase family 4 protein [Nodularia spumigena CS-587/03]MDB9340071.1 glycosyltransferase family 4 protein [Nodularia spumigena CS-589/07]MDB9349195.1 glycosyltransferase family 4 protein [Nodularia spumigena CS-588/01]MDB9352186.1 glycosyltransferase family 4 protein [Nodularia spumigena CS-588/05]MDB9399407.1 glycosyltransferase family 4 protein [Microcystis aeruginosa CS-567/02-A1]